MSETKTNYSTLSIYHKRRIIAANQIGDVALNIICKNMGNDLVRQIQRNAIHFSNTLSEEEVEKKIAELDKLIEEAKSSKAKSIDEITARRRKTRSLFRE